MDIYALSSLSPSTALENAGAAGSSSGKSEFERMKLRQACNDFEAVMVSTILKQGLQSAEELGGDNEAQDSGSKTFKDMANEQMAWQIGRQGLIGLGDSIYNKVKDRM